MRDLHSLRNLVVKIGTGLCLLEDGRIDSVTLLELAQQIRTLRQRGCHVVLVTSGAVGMGRSRLGIQGPVPLDEKQALAAVGQVALMQAYQTIFGLLDICVGQVLLTRQDLESQERYLNARNAFAALLRRGVLPVVNENDSVATEEIKIGDNDQLAALVGNVTDADLVVNLTSTEGLWTSDPAHDPQARVVRDVHVLDESIWAMVRDDKTRLGTGGMHTKLEAAAIAARYGAYTAIAPGRRSGVLLDLLAGDEVGTLFYPRQRRLRGRKRWLAATPKSGGVLYLDAGAVRALREQGRSLLAAGITRLEGRFEVGHLVRLEGPDGQRLGRGLTNYSSEHLDQIKGLPTEQFEGVLGFKGHDEVVHRNHLVLD